MRCFKMTQTEVKEISMRKQLMNDVLINELNSSIKCFGIFLINRNDNPDLYIEELCK